MNSLSSITVIGIAISALFHFVVSFASAQVPVKAPPLIVGKWKLNRGKSDMPPAPADIFELREYRLRPDGYLVGLAISSTPRGYHYLQFTAKTDGKDYPEYTDDLVAEMIATGKPTVRTYAEKVVDEYVSEWTDKADGRVIAQGLKTISKDGKTMTISQQGIPRTYIYDRQ